MDRLAEQTEFQLPLAPSRVGRRLQVYLLLLISDGLAILGGFSLSSFLYLGEWFNQSAMLEAQLTLPIYWTLAIARNGYSIDAALDVRTGIIRTIWALLIAVATVVAAAYLLKASENFSRFISASGFILSLLLMIVSRDFWVSFARSRCGNSGANFLLITDGLPAFHLPDCFHIDAESNHIIPDICDPQAMNRIAGFLTNMDHVLVHCQPERRSDWALVLKGVGIRAEIVYDEVSALGVIGVHPNQQYGGLVVAFGPLGLRDRILKRAFDLTLSVFGLVAFAPLMLCVAIAIKLEDRGPIMFVQQRLGRDNRFFSIYKFRSMHDVHSDPAGANLVTRADRRVTRVGRIIRASSIDELPQLLNILRGEMSLVGPRPHALGSRAGQKLYWEVDKRYWQRHSLKPGLTGLAQVRGFRGETIDESDITSRLQADLEYVDGWTLWRDLEIILATVNVITHRNAY